MTDTITRHRWEHLAGASSGKRRCKKCGVVAIRAIGWLVDYGEGYVFYDPMPQCSRSLFSKEPEAEAGVHPIVDGEATDLDSGHDAKKDLGKFEGWDPRESDAKGYGQNP